MTTNTNTAELKFYPCIEDPRTGKISKKAVDRPMTRQAAENYLKLHHLHQWRQLEAIPQPVNHPYFR